VAASPTTTPWLSFAQPRSTAAIPLFCFPYAGGGASAFRGWADSLPPEVQVYPVQYPGRGQRLREPALRRMSQMVRACYDGLRPHLRPPFAFFGHSMGAKVAFELARYLRRVGGPMPQRLMVSGSRAPQAAERDAATYDLPHDEFVGHVMQLNGMPAEVLDHPELLELILPVLRADFELLDTYACAPQQPFDLPIDAFGGTDDPDVCADDLRAWSAHTSRQFAMRLFPGDHFYLNSCKLSLLAEVASRLSASARAEDVARVGDAVLR
jgi:medium-chain acyl-[acyl-carrier-protein] hydrolase